MGTHKKIKRRSWISQISKTLGAEKKKMKNNVPTNDMEEWMH